jgi:type I restriction enzyme S subunit
LSSKYGHQLLNDYASGSAVRFIQAPSIAKIPVPVLDETIVKSIDEKYISAVTCREKAHELLEKADSLVHQYNNLPSLSEINFETIDPSKETQIRLTNLFEFSKEFRLDSHFYNQIAGVALKNIKEKSSSYLTLKEVTNDIVIGKRFKRNYVESAHGTPFIGSKNILQIRPTELKYLSNSEIGFMNDLMLHKNMILIACSGSLGGTFGKASFVYNNFENYAASQHILRIIANENLIDSGYLYAFLSSEYGYECITRYRWGALIDEIDDQDMSKLLIPLPAAKQQKEIGDLVRNAYDLRAEAIRLEDEAQEIFTEALTKNK